MSESDYSIDEILTAIDEINGKSNMEELKNLLKEPGETKVQIKVKRNSKIYIFSLKNTRKFNFSIFNTLKNKEYIKKISF